MSFKIGSRYREAAQAVNLIPVDKFPRLLSRIFQKLHIKVLKDICIYTQHDETSIAKIEHFIQGAKLFTGEEEDQIKTLFGLTSESLSLVLDGCCYTFEQALILSLILRFPLNDVKRSFHRRRSLRQAQNRCTVSCWKQGSTSLTRKW